MPRKPLPAGSGIIGGGILVLLCLTRPGGVEGDGGTLRVSNVPMGAYRVNVYTDPTPIPPDTVDVSLLVTFERGRGVANDLEIEVIGRRLDGSGETIRHPATREQAQDPRFYAAKFALGTVGEWEIRVVLEGPEGQGETSFRVTVQEPGLFQNPYLVLVVGLLPLVLGGWWLVRTGGRGTPPATTAPEPPSSPSSRPEG